MMNDESDYDYPQEEQARLSESQQSQSFRSNTNEKNTARGLDIEEDIGLIGKETSSKDVVKTFPPDCYSLMALHSPFEAPYYFYFGLLVWTFQISFFLLLVLRVASPKLSTNEDTDNPDNTWIANFIPSNVATITRGTQFLAILSYCIFADESLKDVVTAVEMWPTMSKAKPEDRAWLILTSCLFRFSQGLLATIVVLLLVINTSDVVDIVLNFTAVNFVSAFDDVAFELAQWGKYGPGMEAETKRVEELPLPDCCRRATNYVRFWSIVFPMTLGLIMLLAVVAVRQNSLEHWLTLRLRVQFEDESNMEGFSGCFDMENWQGSGISQKRMRYQSFEKNPSKARFGYCKGDRRNKWYLYEGNVTNPCDAVDNNLHIAFSDVTYSFDISSAFELAWYTRSGTNLELYFFDDNKVNLTDELCESFLGDGYCNADFNLREYRYDQGDCCAETCNYLHCGTGTMSRVFNTPVLAADGYPYCQDSTLKPITILLNDVYTKKNDRSTKDRKPLPPLMTIDCSGRNILMVSIQPAMINETELLDVSDGATCTITVKSRAIGSAEMLHVKYTVFHGDRSSIRSNPIVMLEGDSSESQVVTFQRIEECYFEKLKEHVNISTIYTGGEVSNKAIDWLMKDDSGFSSCEGSHFIERYALAAINFAAPLQTSEVVSRKSESNDSTNQGLWITAERHCIWSHVACVDGSVHDIIFEHYGALISGTIATEIGLLRNLSSIEMNSQLLYGSIPTEVGQLNRLRGLFLGYNALTGTIPTEIGKITRLKDLDLSNNKNVISKVGDDGAVVPIPVGDGLFGTIPSEIINLSSLSKLELYINSITGSIPNKIGALSALTRLAIGGNLLTGTIPTTVAELPGLNFLGLSYNLLTGTIPTELGLLTAQQGIPVIFNLDYNQLTGSVPSELRSNISNTVLTIFGNNLSNLVPVDGSVICKSEAAELYALYSVNTGEHYCDCSSNCFVDPSSFDPNNCACEEGQACCTKALSEATECILCEYGISNPWYIPDNHDNWESDNCYNVANYIRNQTEMYGNKEVCDATRSYFANEYKCVCNMEKLPECIVCEHGVSNPDHIPNHSNNELGLTCEKLATHNYGAEDVCNGTKTVVTNDFGCICNEGSAADTTTSDNGVEV